MKKGIWGLMATFAAVVVIAGCTPAEGGSQKVGNYVGELNRFDGSVHEFTTPSGAQCVFVAGNRLGGLACNWSKT